MQTENKKRPNEVRKIEIVTISFVGIFSDILAYDILDIIVPKQQSILTIPAWFSFAPKDENIIGQDAPSMLSGSPKEIKAI